MTKTLTALASLAVALAFAGAAEAKGCSYKYGVGDYQSISVEGATGCAEARGLIMYVTNDGQLRPRVGIKTGRTPHGTWRCVTTRDTRALGVVWASHRTSCALINDSRGYRARVTWFRIDS